MGGEATSGRLGCRTISGPGALPHARKTGSSPALKRSAPGRHPFPEGRPTAAPNNGREPAASACGRSAGQEEGPVATRSAPARRTPSALQPGNRCAPFMSVGASSPNDTSRWGSDPTVTRTDSPRWTRCPQRRLRWIPLETGLELARRKARLAGGPRTNCSTAEKGPCQRTKPAVALSPPQPASTSVLQHAGKYILKTCCSACAATCG